MDKSFYVIIMYILIHTGFILFLYPENIIESTSQGHWLPIMMQVAFHLIIFVLFIKALQYFPTEEDIISIYTKAGKMIAILMLLPMLLYYLFVMILKVRSYSEIITIVFLSQTPLWAIMALVLGIASYLAVKGVESIFRTGLLVFILLFPLITFSLVVSFQNVDWHYIYPLWVEDFSFLTNKSYYISYFAVGGGFLFLGFIRPFVAFQSKKILYTVVAIIPLFLIAVYIPILTFGQATASTFLFPFVVTIDAVNLTWVMFDRITVFFLLSIFIFILLFLSLVFWIVVRILSRCFPSKTQPIYIVLPVSILIYSICLSIPNWEDLEKLFVWTTILEFYVIIVVPISIILLGLRLKVAGK
ncbi:GerAB/ArcD/ProY family transporter [Lederbergia graminis]|uniref:GerAB/ArcD/ProY family transporter n=1 Tax=Lederbergia graminis TaxID=735518 RepID=A0ABW0LM57_9BACI